MANEDKGGKWKKVIAIIIVIIVILMVLVGLFLGLTSLKQFFTYILIGILVLGILFGLIYLFWLIFIKKEYKDITQQYKNKLVQTAKLMNNELLGELYLSGDSKHNRIKLGKYAYLRIKLPRQKSEVVEVIDNENQAQIQNKMVQTTEAVDIDCFMILKGKIFDKLFSDPIIVMVKPQDHNFSSIFNNVVVQGFNLVPIDNQFYTIDRRNLDMDIFRGLTIQYQREVVHEVFRELDRLVKMSMNLDQEHQKQKEKALQFEMPQMGGGQNQ